MEFQGSFILNSLALRIYLKGFYRGYTSTILREIPFSIIQFPLWEFFKTEFARRKGSDITALDSSLCGALAGKVSWLIVILTCIRIQCRISLLKCRICSATISLFFLVHSQEALQHV